MKKKLFKLIKRNLDFVGFLVIITTSHFFHNEEFVSWKTIPFVIGVAIGGALLSQHGKNQSNK